VFAGIAEIAGVVLGRHVDRRVDAPRLRRRSGELSLPLTAALERLVDDGGLPAGNLASEGGLFGLVVHGSFPGSRPTARSTGSTDDRNAKRADVAAIRDQRAVRVISRLRRVRLLPAGGECLPRTRPGTAGGAARRH